ncbi:MAG: 4-alpha-glucanotransferase [Gaiellaceae bacterium]|nr:4-alpha-glucanotransferase [Gaiellaceae bacterium]
MAGTKRDDKLARSSGVLLHPTSLPNSVLDREAYRFVDWLAAAGQSWWQMLPLGPPDEVGSPYRSASAFAAWDGLLAKPRARVTLGERDDFRERHSGWALDWEWFAGDDALDDQVRFEREWAALRSYAAERGVRLIGDLPIYVAPGSADHLARPDLFQEGEVAGCPPDAFTRLGQLWGNPLYDWAAHRREGFAWWTERFRRSFELFDVVRIDHFRGFVAYWSVPERLRTARGGRWRRGPGGDPFAAAARELGPLRAIAENLGVITPAVERLRHELGFPGMVVVEFAFEGGAANPHALANHRAEDVVYTGTHDHEPLAGWYAAQPAGVRAQIPLDGAAPHWALICLALASPAHLAIVQAQDVLGLGNEARMNTPGSATGNWRWRLRSGELTRELAEQLRNATAAAGRAHL